jgi:UDP-GlcNAc:undecaprenyl-phosphate GlcNAc-1-phosphate transferase
MSVPIFMPWDSIFQLFFSSFVLSAVITHFLKQSRFVDIPTERSAHTMPIPRVGGLAIIASMGILSYVWLMPWVENFSNVLYGISGLASLAFISLWDDIHPQGLGYRPRLFVQFFSSGLFFISLGPLSLNFFNAPQSVQYPIDIAFTLGSFLFFINASNFSDGLNGLLSGCVMIASLFWAFLPLNSSFDMLLCFMLSGSILGFFIFNFHTGRIFLGDVGSTFLGAVSGLITLYSASFYPNPFSSWLVSISVLSFLWVDIALTLIQRVIRGLSITQPHRDFFSHLLNRGGLSHTRVSLIYFLGVIACGSLALFYAYGFLTFKEWALILLLIHGIKTVFVYGFARRRGLFRP